MDTRCHYLNFWSLRTIAGLQLNPPGADWERIHLCDRDRYVSQQRSHRIPEAIASGIGTAGEDRTISNEVNAMSSYSVINELYSISWTNGCLDRSQHQYLQQIRQTNQLNDRDNQLIDRLCHAVRRGWLQVV